MSALARLKLVVTIAATLAAPACAGSDGPADAGVVELRAPASVPAGSDFEVVATTMGTGTVRLDIVDALAVTTLETQVDGRSARFEIEGELTQLAGRVSFHALGPDGAQVTAATTITPAVAASPLDITVGPRTVIADGRDQTMVIAIAADRYGNPLDDGTSVDVTFDDGSTSTVGVTVDHGLASVLVASDTVAGPVEAFASLRDNGGVAVSEIRSPRVDYTEVAGRPEEVSLLVDSPTDAPWPADGRSLVELHTSPIEDRYGNPMPDGYLVRIDVAGPDGRGTLTSTTIDSVARFVLQAPGRPGTVELRADTGDVANQTLVLEFSTAISELPVEVRPGTTGVIVEIGPVLDHGGALVPDGTKAHLAGVSLAGADGVTVELEAGRATVVADADPDGAVTVTVLGTNQRAEW